MHPVDKEKFGFLDTDEELVTNGRKADFEKSVLGGCVTFSIASTAQLAAVGIPFLVARSIMTTDELYKVLAIYLIAAGIVGTLFTGFTGLAGLFGSLAGLIPAATFLWLRLSDAVTGLPGIEGMQPAEYPAAYAYSVPAICVLILVGDFVAAFFVRKALLRKLG
jgi:hypothetical protein